MEHFFRHLKEMFKQQSYDMASPPPILLKNSPSCAKFSDFIADTIFQWVESGAVSIWGEVGSVPPPHLILRVTVEPSKPRLCHDERFLNLWIRDTPFKLDHLTDLPRYVLPGHFQTSFDDKNGYQHVKLHHSSETYFAFE